MSVSVFRHAGLTFQFTRAAFSRNMIIHAVLSMVLHFRENDYDSYVYDVCMYRFIMNHLLTIFLHCYEHIEYSMLLNVVFPVPIHPFCGEGN